MLLQGISLCWRALLIFAHAPLQPIEGRVGGLLLTRTLTRRAAFWPGLMLLYCAKLLAPRQQVDNESDSRS